MDVMITLNRSLKMAKKKKYLRPDEPCSVCGSKSGPCNMWKPEIIEPRWISFSGHCQDCGHSFTRIFSLTFVEERERN